MKNDKSSQALFKLELKVWIAKQVKDGKFKNDLACLEHLTKKLGTREREGVVSPYTVDTIKNYVYGQRWPVLPKHAKVWSKVTKIPKRVFNPEIFD